MKTVILLAFALFAIGPAHAQVELNGTDLYFDDIYQDAGWTTFVSPKLVVDNKFYSIARSSDIGMLCKALGFTEADQANTAGRSVYPAGLKAVVKPDGLVDLVDEAEGCFWNICLTPSPILIPIHKLYCRQYASTSYTHFARTEQIFRKDYTDRDQPACVSGSEYGASDKFILQYNGQAIGAFVTFDTCEKLEATSSNDLICVSNGDFGALHEFVLFDFRISKRLGSPTSLDNCLERLANTGPSDQSIGTH